MIQVIHGYRVREGVVIPKGFYEDDATELLGLAEYLLDNKHARIATPGDIEVEQETVEALAFEDYDGDLLDVHQGYRVSSGHIINAGLYRPDDPSLAGKAEYLVENRYATWRKRPPKVKAESETPPPTPHVNKQMKADELKALAASLGVTVPEGATKDVIVKAIEDDAAAKAAASIPPDDKPKD